MLIRVTFEDGGDRHSWEIEVNGGTDTRCSTMLRGLTNAAIEDGAKIPGLWQEVVTPAPEQVDTELMSVDCANCGATIHEGELWDLNDEVVCEACWREGQPTEEHITDPETIDDYQQHTNPRGRHLNNTGGRETE